MKTRRDKTTQKRKKDEGKRKTHLRETKGGKRK